MVQEFDREVSRIIERFVPIVAVRRRGGYAAWSDGDCRCEFELKQSAYHRWNCTTVNWDYSAKHEVLLKDYATAKARYSANYRRNLDDSA